MVQVLPKVIPINELKNTAKISQLCKESDVPIVVTRNGYGEMVLMSVALYERTMAEFRASSPVVSPAPTGESPARAASGTPPSRVTSSDESPDDDFALLGAIYGD